MSNKFIFVKMDGCPHCVSFQRTYDEMRNDNEITRMVELPDPIPHTSIPEQYAPYCDKGFPTLLLHAGNQIHPYEGNRSKEAIKAFIRSKLNKNGGGRKTDDEYKAKYLKYKAKYFKLKSQYM